MGLRGEGEGNYYITLLHTTTDRESRDYYHIDRENMVYYWTDRENSYYSGQIGRIVTTTVR